MSPVQTLLETLFGTEARKPARCRGLAGHLGQLRQKNRRSSRARERERWERVSLIFARSSWRLLRRYTLKSCPSQDQSGLCVSFCAQCKKVKFLYRVFLGVHIQFAHTHTHGGATKNNILLLCASAAALGPRMLVV